MPAASPGVAGFTLTTDVGAFKKVYAPLKDAIVWTTPEFEWIDDLADEDIVLSGDTMYLPLDVQQGFGAAAIPEGGREGLPVSPTIQYGTLSLTAWNARIGISRHSKLLNSQSRAAMVKAEITYKTQKRLEALRHKAALNFYGFNTGVVAKITAAYTGTTLTLTLTQAFGDANLTDTTYISQLINVGDQIAVRTGGTSLVANSVGLVGAKSSNVFTVTFVGATTLASGNEILFANNAGYGDTFTLADHTDHNKWQPGLKDAIESTSLHGVSGSTYPGWTSAVTDSSGGRFTPIKLVKIRQLMANAGKPLAKLVTAQGVYRDMIDQQNALVRFPGIDGVQFDGQAKTREERVESRYTPNGHVFGMAKNAIRKKILGDMPNSGPGEMDKLQDYARYVDGEDFIWLLAYQTRKGLAEYRGLTES